MAKSNRKTRKKGPKTHAPTSERWAPGPYFDGRLRVGRHKSGSDVKRNEVWIDRRFFANAHFAASEPARPAGLDDREPTGADATHVRLVHRDRDRVAELEAYLDALADLVGRYDDGRLKTNADFMTVPCGQKGRYDVVDRDTENGFYAVVERLTERERPSDALHALSCGKRHDGARLVPGSQTKRLRDLMNRSARQRERAERSPEPFREEDLPETTYLTVGIRDGRAVLSYTPPESVTLGSKRERDDLVHLAASLFRKTRPSRGCERRPDHAEAVFSGAEKAKVARLIDRTEEALREATTAPLHPTAVEELLGLNRRERALWRDEGRLVPQTYETVRKNGVTFDVPYYNRLEVAAVTREDVAAWRAEREKRKAANRKAAGRKAAGSRKRNETARKNERERVHALAREVAKETGDLSAVETVRLAILANMASRLAKSARRRDGAEGSDRLYAMKTRALEAIARSAVAEVRFVPGPGRTEADFCLKHLDEYREERRLVGGDLPGAAWAEENFRRLKKCPECSIRTETDHYALYETAIETDGFKIALHTPYPVGRRRDWPDKSALPRTGGRDDGEGFFRLGRPADEDERLLYPAKRLVEEMRESISRLERVLPPAGGVSDGPETPRTRSPIPG